MGAKWIWGIILIALAALLLTFVGPYNAKQRSVDMGTSIEQALKAENINANVDMQGNVAHLTGEQPSQSVLDKALSVAKGTPCKTCRDGKSEIWHKVTSDMTVKPAPAKPVKPAEPKLKLQSPYTFEAIKGEEGVVLSGYVANNKAKGAILSAAKEMFSKVDDNKISLARGQLNSAWPDLVKAKLSDLAKLDSGKLSIEDSQVLLTGMTSDAAIRDGLNVSVLDVPEGYNAAANISVPNLAAVNVGEVNSGAVCQTLFDDLKGDGKINFASSKSELRGTPTYDLLNNLVSAANQCASFRIRVEGHTDSQGDEAYNQWLSEMRAKSVVDYIVKQGVAAQRLTALGLGESQPIASNDTGEGRAQNRRIEFIVTQQSE